MKKIVFAFFILVLLFVPFILSDVATTLEQNVQTAQNVKDTIDKSSDTQYWQEKWDYLGNEWKTIFLKNPVVAAFDSFFTQISIVFEVLFGVPYELSFALLGIFVLWAFVLFNVSKLVEAGGLLSGGLSYLGGLLLCIILAQFKAFEYITLFLGRLAFSPDYIWTRLVIMFIIFASFGLIAYLDRMLSIYLRQKRKAAKERSAQVAQKVITKFSENLLEQSKG